MKVSVEDQSCWPTRGGASPFGTDSNHVGPRPPEGLSSVVAIAMGEKAGCVLQGVDQVASWVMGVRSWRRDAATYRSAARSAV